MPKPQFDDSFLKPKIATSGSPVLKSEENVINVATRPQFDDSFLKPGIATSGSLDTDIDQGKAAELYPLSQATGIPVESLYENYDEVKKVIQSKKDEGLIRSMQASYKVADYTLRKNWLNWRWLNGDEDPNIDAEITKLNRQIERESQFITDDGLFDKAMNTATGLLPVRFKSTAAGIKGGLVTSMLLGGATALVMPPAAPAGAGMGFKSGLVAFSTLYMTRIEAGALADTLRNLKDDKGNPIDPKIVRTFAMAYGAVSGALEAVELKLLLKTVPGLDNMMKDLVQKSVTKLIKDGSVSKFLLASSGRYAKFLLSETAIEVAQESASIITEEFAKNVHELETDGVIDDVTAEEVVTRLKDTAFSSILGFGVLGAPGHVMQTLPGIIDYRSQVKEKALQDLFPEDMNTDYTQEMGNTYERVKNLFFGERDLRVIKNKNEGRLLGEELEGLVGDRQTKEELAVAMSLYRDSKNNPEAVEAALKGEKYAALEEKVIVVDEYISEKGNVYNKKKGKWYDKEGKEVTDRYKVRAIEKGVHYKNIKEETETLTGEAVRKGKVATKEEIAEAKIKLKEVEAKVDDLLEQAKKAKIAGDVETATKLTSEAGYIGQKEGQALNEMIQAAEGRDFGRKPKKVSVPLSETQTRLIEMSKNLTQKQKTFINKIGNIYDAVAEEALGDEIIFNTINNFTSRSWISNKKTRDIISRLTQTTIHAKERRLPTIVEGWTEGLSMKTHSIVDNLVMYREDMIKVIEQKRFIQAMLKGKTEAGTPIFSTKRLQGYEKVEMPRYTPKKGTVYFAPRDVARNINNIFGVSALDKLVGVKSLTKFNALLKKVALSTSLFHNVAFFRSFYLGGKSVQWDNMNVFTAHREGVEMIKNMDEMVKIGVYNGLTLSLIQDWEEELFVMGSDIDKITNKHTKSKRIRSLVSDLWRRQVNFTFGVQGAGLKVKAFAYEFQNECKKHPDENKNRIAARVAGLINDDFGGLHLERIGRDKTMQHIFRLVALAPDWCSSGDTRAMTKTGWKYHFELEIGDEIMTFDPKTKTFKWGKLNDLYANCEYIGKMIKIRSYTRSILMTPNHTCYVYNSTTKRNEIVKAHELQTNHQIPRCANFEMPTEKTYSDIYVKLVGWFATDGYTKISGDCGQYKYGKITQSKPYTVALLKKFGMKYHTDSTHCNQDNFKANYYKHTFTIPKKYFTRMQKDRLCEGLNWNFLSKLTKRQLIVLYDTMYLSDGTGQRRFCGKEKEVFYMTLIQTLLGLPSTFYQQEENCWRTRWISYRNISCSIPRKQEINYIGTVWCPSVDTGFWLAEREGLMFITGNTESNIRTVTGMFKREKKGGYAEQRQLYRRFWARIVLKTAVATAIGNVLLAGGDIDETWERYKEGVDTDWKNIASIDITGLWHLFGMKPQDRKYFSIAGHFLDPVKYTDILMGEPKILQHKMSIVARLTSDWLSNENWRGKRFKNLAEIPTGVKEFAEYLDPDTYVTYAPERRRGGTFLETHFTWPAFLIHSIIGGSPIAFQNLLACISGEQDVFSGISNVLGVRQPRTKRKRGWK